MSVIARGAGDVDALVTALRQREQQRAALQAELQTCRPTMSAAEIRHTRLALEAMASGWRQILQQEPEHARPILSALLDGRVKFTPTGRRSWKMEGAGTLRGVFTANLSTGKDNLSAGLASPTGFEPVFWP